MVSDSFLGTGAAAVVDGAVDFKPFSSGFQGIGFGKPVLKSGLEAAAYYATGTLMEHLAPVSTKNGYSGIAHVLNVNASSTTNVVTNNAGDKINP